MAPTSSQRFNSSRPCLVGLTGGLASGKSTVAGLLTRRGVPVFDADGAVHDLYRSGRRGADVVARIFGSEVLDADGGVDRDSLAARVVEDDHARSSLEAAIHPLVRQMIESWTHSLNAPVAVVEAALLAETGSWRAYDVLMVVWCEPSQQIERAVARGIPEERAKGLLAAQLPINEKIRIADVAVDNRGSVDALASEVNRAWVDALRICRERASKIDAGMRNSEFRIPNS